MIGHFPKKDAVSAIPENDAIQKAYEKSKYPEKAGRKKFEEKEALEKAYQDILHSITKDEFDSLNYLVKNGGYVCLDKTVLKSIGEAGESLHISRLEEWELVKRDRVDSDLIQFTIKSQGKRIVSEMKRLTGVE